MISVLTPQESQRHRVELVQAMERAINETLLGQPATDAVGAIVVLVQRQGVTGEMLSASVDSFPIAAAFGPEKEALRGIHNIVQQRLQGASMASAAQLIQGGK